MPLPWGLRGLLLCKVCSPVGGGSLRGRAPWVVPTSPTVAFSFCDNMVGNLPGVVGLGEGRLGVQLSRTCQRFSMLWHIYKIFACVTHWGRQWLGQLLWLTLFSPVVSGPSKGWEPLDFGHTATSLCIDRKNQCLGRTPDLLPYSSSLGLPALEK